MTHPQRVHHFPDDYAFHPEKGVKLRRRYGERVVDLVPRKHARAALRLRTGKHGYVASWAYSSVGDAMASLAGWNGEGAPPESTPDVDADEVAS
jgi:hypothetical protein